MPIRTDEELNKKMSRKRIRGDEETMEAQNHNGADATLRESSPSIDAVSF